MHLNENILFLLGIELDPCACYAHEMTTTPRNHVCYMLPNSYLKYACQDVMWRYDVINNTNDFFARAWIVSKLYVPVILKDKKQNKESSIFFCERKNVTSGSLRTVSLWQNVKIKRRHQGPVVYPILAQVERAFNILNSI